MESISPGLTPLVDGLWRDRLRGMGDHHLADALRGWARWRADWSELAALLAGHDPALAESIRRGAEDAAAALTRPLIAEARRRARVRRLPPRRRVCVDDLLNRFPDRIKPAGNGRWKGRCAWHEDQTPSMVVYPDHAHCYSCGAHRPLADLLAAWRNEAA